MRDERQIILQSVEGLYREQVQAHLLNYYGAQNTCLPKEIGFWCKLISEYVNCTFLKIQSIL